jgi:hypothetical protein
MSAATWAKNDWKKSLSKTLAGLEIASWESLWPLPKE